MCGGGGARVCVYVCGGPLAVHSNNRSFVATNEAKKDSSKWEGSMGCYIYKME